MFGAQYSDSPAIVEALLKAKANVHTKDNVRHLECNRCEPYVVIDHSCVFVEGRQDSFDVWCAIFRLPGHRRGLVESEGQREHEGEAFGV